MSATTVTLMSDTAGLEACLAELSALAEGSGEVRELLAGFLERGEQLVTLHTDVASATATGELIVRFDPSDSLLGLLAAFRAGNAKRLLVEGGIETAGRHVEVPIDSGVATTTIGEAGAGVESVSADISGTTE